MVILAVSASAYAGLMVEVGWASRVTAGDPSPPTSPELMLGPPDGRMATFTSADGGATYGGFTDSRAYDRAALAALLGVSVATLDQTDVISFEFNGMSLPFEDSNWTFAAGGNTEVLTPADSLSLGIVSVSAYGSFFGISLPAYPPFSAYVLFDLQVVDPLAADFEVTLQGVGAPGQLGTPDPDCLGVIPEPATLALLGLGAVAVLRRGRTGRRRRGMFRGTFKSISIGVGVALIAVALSSANFAQAGETVAWGWNKYGHVSGRPTGSEFVDIAGGYYQSLALKSDGFIISWGTDDNGLISKTPTAGNFVGVDAGYAHSLALDSDGLVVSWGQDAYGQVSETPTSSGFVDIAAGWFHNLALEPDGSITSWGWDQAGVAPATYDFVRIAAGYYHSLALQSDGSIVSWGQDDHGQVSNTPGGTDFVDIAAGWYHSLALKSDGSIVSWGNDWGQPVSGTPTGSDFVDVDAGGFHSLARKSDGAIISWGYDEYGQVTWTPAGSGHVEIAGGVYHSLALIPEPATLALLGLGAMALWRRVKR